MSNVNIFLILILLIPISKRSVYCNRCIEKIVSWINEKEKSLEGWDLIAKQSIAVGVCMVQSMNQESIQSNDIFLNNFIN